MREFGERMKVISHSPVRIFVASYQPRYWYPYRLQHAGDARPWVKDESLQVIIDSAIGDDEIGNEETLDRAAELNADYVIAADTLNDQEATTESVREFADLYDDHHCRATPLIPLQPPYDEHYDVLDGWSHYTLGGIKDEDPEVQVREIRRFREAAGDHVYAHGLGLGGTLTLIKALREEPRLLDSLDLSTPEQVVRNDKITDKSWKHQAFFYPRGDDSSTVRAQYAVATALQLNYMLGPFCDDDILEDEVYYQSALPAGGPASGGAADD